jgi:hypothetical protein
MMLGGFVRMVGRMLRMAVGYVSVMTGLLMIPGFMMLGSFAVVFRRVVVMFGRLMVMLCTFVCRHLWNPPFQCRLF